MAAFQPSREAALALDAEDELAAYRDQFYLPQAPSGQAMTYLCGHSLGLQPQTVRDHIDEELQDWATWGVEGHFNARRPWLSYHETLTAQTARLVGAHPIEVVVMNSLTVNMHLMLVSFYHPTPERFKILIEADAFPSDRYAVESHLKWHGYDPQEALLTLRPRPDEGAVRQEDIADFMACEGASIALIWLGGVNYYTGQVFDMAEMTRLGHAQGCLVGFDLAHATGNIPLHLHDWDVDCAVWCSYKYLNAGPGAVAGCFVHERHAQRPDLSRLAGWWGHDKTSRFQMPPNFDPIPGAEGWQVSNPPIFQLAALRASMAIFDEAGMARLRTKSERLTGYLQSAIEAHALPGVALITPDDPAQRGAQLSLQIERHGHALHQRLTQANIICDWREPDVIRVAPVPLYNTFSDVLTFANALGAAHREVLAS